MIARVVYACLGAHGRVYFMTRKVCSALLVVQDDIVHSHHQTLSSHKRCLLPFIYRLRVQESNSMPPHTMKWNYREANACDSISFSTPYWILGKNEISTKHLYEYTLLIEVLVEWSNLIQIFNCVKGKFHLRLKNPCRQTKTSWWLPPGIWRNGCQKWREAVFHHRSSSA